jgi:hypothetical protein
MRELELEMAERKRREREEEEFRGMLEEAEMDLQAAFGRAEKIKEMGRRIADLQIPLI